MMTANFHSINMPVVNPTEPASEENKIIGASANNTHRNVTTGNMTSNDTTIDDHNQSSSMNHDDHSSMHNHDHSSHSMPMMSQGTVMYMDGFQSALFHNSQNPPPCLNFLHPSVRSFCIHDSIDIALQRFNKTC